MEIRNAGRLTVARMGRGSIRMPATIATNSRCFIECAECAGMGQFDGAEEPGKIEGMLFGFVCAGDTAKCQGVMHEYQLSNASRSTSSTKA